jgi:gluconate 5-dehydrogenase
MPETRSPPSSASAPRDATFDLDGKVAFVAGGYGAIGAAIARGLARCGAEVIVAGHDARKSAELATELGGHGARAHGITMDARSVASIRDAVDSSARRSGRIDILINCVGIQREEALLEVSEAAYDEVYAVNLKAAMFIGQAVARHQVAAALGGRHVHVLSVRAHLGLRDRGYSAYCSTKGGLAMLVKQHAMELARHGITVNGVAPTVVRSAMASHCLDNPVTRKQITDRIPLGRVAEPTDVVGPTLLFCSIDAGFVTGQILYIDGGITASQ